MKHPTTKICFYRNLVQFKAFSTQNNFNLPYTRLNNRRDYPSAQIFPSLVLQSSFSKELYKVNWFSTKRKEKYIWLKFLLFYYHRIILSQFPRRFRRKFPRHLRTKRLRSFAAWVSPAQQLAIFTRFVSRFLNQSGVVGAGLAAKETILLSRPKSLRLLKWFYYHVTHFFAFDKKSNYFFMKSLNHLRLPEPVYREYSLQYNRGLIGQRWLPTRFVNFLSLRELKKRTGISDEPSIWERSIDMLIENRKILKTYRKGLNLESLRLNKALLLLQYFYSLYPVFIRTVNNRPFLRSTPLIFYHELIFKFNQNRLFISLLDPHQRRNHFCLRPGFLMKFLSHKRKSAKKTLQVKLLLAKFVRKLLISTRIRTLELTIKGVPLFLPQLFRFLTKPLGHKFYDPIAGKRVDETTGNYWKFNFTKLIFIRYKPHGYQKTRKRGRIKRKIKRKIVARARVIDEA